MGPTAVFRVNHSLNIMSKGEQHKVVINKSDSDLP